MSDVTAKNVLMAAFRKAAIAGARCPDNDQLSDLVYQAGGRQWRQALDELVREGKIRIEIAGKNWRVVYLLGENLNTQLEPCGRHSWRTIDALGSRRA